ncbi:MAG: thioredoxin TrxC [Rhizobacter sp.]|nr:thioredoxin TrxC [Burkholderiales bacterium]
MHLVCPECGAVNRVPEQRLDDGPVCGTCKAALLAAQPIVLNDSSFNNFIARTELPVVIDFWAAWCGPCKMMAPHFSEAAKQMPRVRFAKVDTEAATLTAARFSIRSIPTLVLFKGGQEIARQPGAMQAGDITRWITAHS